MIKVPLWLRDYIKHDGSRELTSDWDIGNGRMIKADKLRARDSDGLALYEDGGAGIFVKNGGYVGFGTNAPAAEAHIKGTAYPELRIESTDVEGGQLAFVSSTGYWVLRINETSLNFYKGGNKMTLLDSGYFGIGTDVPGNPLAVNRSADGTIVDFESGDSVEGNVSIAGNTTSYNAFMGSHYTQLKEGQAVPPVGAIVIATGEVIPCESNIEAPVMEMYYEEELETSLKDSIEDEIIKEDVDTGRKQTAYIFINGKVIKTKIPVLETVTKVKGKKLKECCHIDEATGKVYKKIDKVLNVDEEPPENVTVLERRKTKDGAQVTEIKAKEVSGIEKKEYFSYVELASQKADKRVYGVYHAKLGDDAKGQSFGEDDKAVHQIAALGLYKMRVTDMNGDIAAGNYIQSSIRLGEGEKQDDDVLHNYTVGKAIINVNFSEIEMDLKLGYKWQLIPVTLHCG